MAWIAPFTAHNSKFFYFFKPTCPKDLTQTTFPLETTSSIRGIDLVSRFNLTNRRIIYKYTPIN